MTPDPASRPLAHVKRCRCPRRLRYEVQVRLLYGWVSAGNWPVRNRAEGLRSLKECATSIQGGAVHNYRLVRLIAKPLKSYPATMRFDQKTQRYIALSRRKRNHD